MILQLSCQFLPEFWRRLAHAYRAKIPIFNEARGLLVRASEKVRDNLKAMKLYQKILSAIFASTLFSCSTVTVTRMNGYRMQKDVSYKKGVGTKKDEEYNLTGDLYTPNVPGPKAAVIVVHGGGWDSDSGSMYEISTDLAGSGFVVFNIRYRLAPEFLYPNSVEDVRDAIKFVRDHAKEFEVDPNQISLWGYSAGAHLVLMAGLDPAMHVQAIVAGGTPADFPFWPHSPIITKYIGKSYADAKQTWEEASPINHVSENSPPVFLYHGHNDHLVEVEQMYKMRDALEHKNVEVKTYEVPVFGHIFTYLFSVASIKKGIQFLEAHTRQSMPH